MHNIKDIRNNLDNFKKSLSTRNIDINVDEILDLDQKNRNFIQEKEKYEMEKKSISKSKDQKLFDKSKEISIKIDELSTNQKLIKYQLDEILSTIPNIPLSEVPVGKNENDNKEIVKTGVVPKFDFKPFYS